MPKHTPSERAKQLDRAKQAAKSEAKRRKGIAQHSQFKAIDDVGEMLGAVVKFVKNRSKKK